MGGRLVIFLNYGAHFPPKRWKKVLKCMYYLVRYSSVKITFDSCPSTPPCYLSTIIKSAWSRYATLHVEVRICFYLKWKFGKTNQSRDVYATSVDQRRTIETDWNAKIMWKTCTNSTWVFLLSALLASHLRMKIGDMA